MRISSEIKILGTYSVVTIATTLLYLLLYVSLVEVLSFSPMMAAIFGYLPCLIIGFLLAQHWVFRSKTKYVQTAYRYMVVNGVGYMWNLAAIFVLAEVWSLNYILSQFLAFVIVATNNYTLNRLWTFSNKGVAALEINSSSLR